jgi:hypothetical protein
MGVAVLYFALEKCISKLGADRNQGVDFRRAECIHAVNFVICEGEMSLNQASLLQSLYVSHGSPLEVVEQSKSITTHPTQPNVSTQIIE